VLIRIELEIRSQNQLTEMLWSFVSLTNIDARSLGCLYVRIAQKRTSIKLSVVMRHFWLCIIIHVHDDNVVYGGADLHCVLFFWFSIGVACMAITAVHAVAWRAG